ncbi:DDRGK domain-containing protein 1-like [Sycon ciliatum]|uniref:DDRGK domain-containing protein 1-like n=1 Tax=Sycon ciliatum TaxID=27933 RepID=UPI0031F6FD91|eukprot:scpid82914/ scgid31402/ 
MSITAMLRALRALLYKVFLISLICKFVTRLKRILGIKGSSSTGADLFPTSSKTALSGGSSAGGGGEEDANEDGGDWGSWDNQEPFSIEVTGQKSEAEAKVYSSKAKPPPEPEPEPDVDFFTDMEPVIQKAAQQKLRVKSRNGGGASSAQANRFAFQDPTPPPAELEAWDDDEEGGPTSAWDEDVLDDSEAEAISAEAKKQKREVERQRRQLERDQRRQQQEQKRQQEQLQRKQLGMKIS